MKKRDLERRTSKRVEMKVFGVWGMIELGNHLFNQYFHTYFVPDTMWGIGVQRRKDLIIDFKEIYK